MNELNKWRKQIDDIDQDLITDLAKRMAIVRKIGKFKKDHSISAFDEKRWEQILETNLKKGAAAGFSKKFIKRIFGFIHQYSLKIQQNLDD